MDSLHWIYFILFSENINQNEILSVYPNVEVSPVGIPRIDGPALVHSLSFIWFTRCVICHLLVLWGGRSVEFFRNFRHTYLSGFYKYNSDQVVKSHLRDQENRLARTRRARAVARVETAPPPVNLEKKPKILHIMCHMCWSVTRLKPRVPFWCTPINFPGQVIGF